MVKHAPRSSDYLFLQKTPIIAHRGGSNEAPENTLAAFRKATDSGYAVECDVRMSRDGRIVVFHDDILGRTTNGRGRVADRSLDELKVLDAGDGERIPRLTEVLGLIDHRVPIIIEVKCDSWGSRARRMASALIDDIMLMKAMNNIVVASFNPYILLCVKKIMPKLLRSLIFSKRSWFAFKELVGKPDILMPNYRIVDKTLVDSMHKRGYRVFPWTVDDQVNAQRMIAHGVDGIITNRPSSLLLT